MNRRICWLKGEPRQPEQPIPDVLEMRYSGNRIHPTQKPVSALIPLIESFSLPGDVVLDPFCGSALPWWRRGRWTGASSAWNLIPPTTRSPRNGYSPCYRLPMPCLTCEQLTAEFERLERRYADARGQLSAFSETGSPRTYRVVKEFADEARLEYEVSRIELERHQRTHNRPA